MALVKTSLSLTTAQLDALKAEAERLDLPMGEMLRRVLDAWREAPPPYGPAPRTKGSPPGG